LTTASFTTDLDAPRSTRGRARPGLWTRLRAALAQAHLERTEREIALYIAENGGRLTDQLERRILDRVSGLDRGSFS
jgi:hypothetical protein